MANGSVVPSDVIGSRRFNLGGQFVRDGFTLSDDDRARASNAQVTPAMEGRPGHLWSLNVRCGGQAHVQTEKC